VAGIGLNWFSLSLQYPALDLRLDNAQLLGLRLAYSRHF